MIISIPQKFHGLEFLDKTRETFSIDNKGPRTVRQSLHQNHNFMVIAKKVQNLTYRGSRLEAEYQVLVKSTLNINSYVLSLFYMPSPVAFKVSKL